MEESTISLMTCITSHYFDHRICPRNDCYLHQEMCLCHSDTPSHNDRTYFNKASAFPSTLRSELPNEVILRWTIKIFCSAILITFFALNSPSVNYEEPIDPSVLSQLPSMISISLLLGHCLHLSSDTMLRLGMFYARAIYLNFHS